MNAVAQLRWHRFVKYVLSVAIACFVRQCDLGFLANNGSTCRTHPLKESGPTQRQVQQVGRLLPIELTSGFSGVALRRARRQLLLPGGALKRGCTLLGYSVPGRMATLGLLSFAFVVIKSAIVIVRTGETVLVERLGRFSRRLAPGFHIAVPVIDVIRARLTVREQVLDIPPQGCITQDNAPLKADAVVYWRIFDPELAVYAVSDLVPAIQNLVLTQLRGEIGKQSLDETFGSRARMNEVLLRDLDQATDPWGVKITRVEIRDIIPNKEILSSMEMQMAAERTKRAQIIKSEGQRQALLNEASGRAEARVVEAESHKTAQILRAQGEKERILQEAEGTASALRLLAEASGGDLDRAVRLQLMRAYIDAQVAVATSSNAKVLLFPSTEEWGAKAGAVLGEMQSGALVEGLARARAVPQKGDLEAN